MIRPSRSLGIVYLHKTSFRFLFVTLVIFQQLVIKSFDAQVCLRHNDSKFARHVGQNREKNICCL